MTGICWTWVKAKWDWLTNLDGWSLLEWALNRMVSMAESYSSSDSDELDSED